MENKIKLHPGDFTKICSAHFVDSDFKNPYSKVRRLRADAIPSVFPWSQQVVPRPFVEKKRRLEEERELALAEETETASEGEGICERDTNCGGVSHGTQADMPLPCLHRFSLQALLIMADTPAKKAEYIAHYTGFSSYERFKEV